MQNMPSILTPDFGLMFWMLLAFLVVFGLLAKFGFPTIVKAVEDRKNFIDESLKNAREAKEKLANIKVESEQILHEAHEKQAQIIKEAMATRDNIINETKGKAQTEGQQLLEDAKKQIAAEKENALADIRSQVADLSVQIAEKVIRRQLQSNDEQEQYIQRMLNDVK